MVRVEAARADSMAVLVVKVASPALRRAKAIRIVSAKALLEAAIKVAAIREIEAVTRVQDQTVAVTRAVVRDTRAQDRAVVVTRVVVRDIRAVDLVQAAGLDRAWAEDQALVVEKLPLLKEIRLR
mgnify:CR=1 FL=1